jgi:hypothetical protein
MQKTAFRPSAFFPEEAETTAISTQPNVDRSVSGDLRIVAALNECRGKSRDLSVGSVLQTDAKSGYIDKTGKVIWQPSN